MRCARVILAGLFVGLTPTFFAASGPEFEAQGIKWLVLSQTEPDAIIAAAIEFGRATAAYERARDEGKVTEINSYLYWCKKKMTLAQMETFLKRNGGEEKDAIASLQALDKIRVSSKDAQLYNQRAETFAFAHPNEHLLVAIRFFEVADRFNGTEIGSRAMDRSSKEMMASQGKAAPVATTRPSRSKTGNFVVNPPPEAPAKNAAATGRKPVPDPAQQKASEKTIRDLYQAEFAKTAPQERVDFAKKLNVQADETLDDWSGRYVLRTLAIQLAAQLGEVTMMLNIIDKLVADYDSDFKELKKSYFSMIASGAREPALAKFAAAYTVTVDKPADLSANLAAGKFLCFNLNDFDRGLPFLARTAQGLGTVARLELPPPEDTEKQLKLADTWWDLGEKSTDKDEKGSIRKHAMAWYKTALPGLSGLSKAKLEKRIGDFDAELASANRKMPVSTAPAAPATPISQTSKADLLKLIDIAKSSAQSDFRMVRGALEAFSGQKYRSIRLPFKPPAEYDLRVAFKRTSGNGDIGFFVVADEQKALLSLCGWQNTLAGFHGINGHDVDSSQNPTKTNFGIENGKDYRLLVEVRKGSIRAQINEKELLHYKFDKPGFTNLDGTPAKADGSSLGVYCSECTARITQLELTNVSP